MISTQFSKYVRELDSAEERALVYLALESTVYKESQKLFFKDSKAQALWNEIY